MARRAKQQELRPNVSPDDIASCYAEYSQLRADAARVGQRIAVTLARYEKQGVNPTSIKRSYAAAQKDPSEVAAQDRTDADYKRILEIVTVEDSGQGAFTAGLVVPQPSAEASSKVRGARAYNDAYNSALHGAKLDSNPFGHAPGSEEFVCWISGFEDGHDDRLAKNPDADKVTQATPRKRGRPPKAHDASPSPAAPDAVANLAA